MRGRDRRRVSWRSTARATRSEWLRVLADLGTPLAFRGDVRVIASLAFSVEAGLELVEDLLHLMPGSGVDDSRSIRVTCRRKGRSRMR